MAADLVLVVLSSLAILALIAIAASLADAVRFRRRVRESLRWSWTSYSPNVLLIVPCRGADVELGRNIEAILRQTGVAYRTVLVVDSPDDPAAAAIRGATAGSPQAGAAVLVASPRRGYSGKASALLRGLEERTPGDEVVAFADSDIRTDPRWLRTLVQPLADPLVGSATGYRWYIPAGGAMPSVARAAWNAVGMNIFFDDRYNFAWGGSNAIRAETLGAIDVASRWRGTLSEDLALTDSVKAMGRTVAFVPAAVSPTVEGCTWRELLEWSTRQTAMVAVWGRHIGRYAALTYGVFNGISVLGVVALVLGAFVDPLYFLPAAAFLVNLPATIAKNHHRAESVFLGNPALRAMWRVRGGRFALAALLVPWLVTYNLARAGRMREVEWRGRLYRVERGTIVDSPRET